MDVTVDDNNTPNPSFCLHRSRGDNTVVKQTEPLPVVFKGVMRSASQTDCDPLSQRCTAGLDSRTAGTSGTLDQLDRPGKSDASGLLFC
jgi:hypothetical protein